MNLRCATLATGLRRGEALGLRWEDVDLDGGALYVIQQIVEVRGQPVVGTPKTKHGARVLSLDTVTVASLRRHRSVQDLERSAWGPAWNGAGLVFTREDGRGLRPQHATKHFAVLAGQLGLPVIRVHDLRHTHASVALAAGVDLKVVSERLGHSQISITADLYTHVSRGVSQAAADLIAGAMRGTSNALPAASLQHDAEMTEIDDPVGEERARPPPGSLQVRGHERLPRETEPAAGLEPATPCLQDKCAANCATPASRRNRRGRAKAYPSGNGPLPTTMAAGKA